MSAGSSDRYGSLAIWIHWLSAAAIVVLFALGVAANAAEPALKAGLLRAHVPLGLLVLLLTVLRVVWWFIDRPPAPLEGQPRWQVATEMLVRLLNVAVIVVLGVSGIGLVALSGAGAVLFFGAPGPLADFWQFTPMFVHFAMAMALFALVALHVAAALYHHYSRRDGLLARMGIG